MIALFNYFGGRYWREMVISALDPWSMLELLKTNKQLNRHKSYIYMLIYQKIFMRHYEEISVPCIIKYHTFNEYFIYCSKEHLKTLLKHNKYIRAMMERYINSCKRLYIYRAEIKAITCNQVSKYEELLS
tara:strand:- start:15191 stop:15580 length:390 start_codon:yes stop_codon:yes gene_type:complete